MGDEAAGLVPRFVSRDGSDRAKQGALHRVSEHRPIAFLESSNGKKGAEVDERPTGHTEPQGQLEWNEHEDHDGAGDQRTPEGVGQVDTNDVSSGYDRTEGAGDRRPREECRRRSERAEGGDEGEGQRDEYDGSGRSHIEVLGLPPRDREGRTVPDAGA